MKQIRPLLHFSVITMNSPALKTVFTNLSEFYMTVSLFLTRVLMIESNKQNTNTDKHYYQRIM